MNFLVLVSHTILNNNNGYQYENIDPQSTAMGRSAFWTTEAAGVRAVMLTNHLSEE